MINQTSSRNVNMTKKDIKELVRKTVSDIKKHKEVQAIWLFGSHVAGTARRDSDIDICVMVDKDTKKHVISNIVSNSSEKIDIQVWHEIPIYIRYRVLRDGKQIYQKSWRYVNRQKISCINEYLEFAPFLHKYTEAAIGR